MIEILRKYLLLLTIVTLHNSNNSFSFILSFIRIMLMHMFSDGVHFVTFTSEPIKLLPYLMKRFKNAGGHFEKMKIHNLKDFVLNSNYDIIINCVGLNAKDIVPDTKMYSIRGQVIRYNAPWIYLIFLDESDDGNYVIPK